MPYPCVESTLDIVVADKMVRLWINTTAVPTVLPAFRKQIAEIKEQVMRLKPPAFMAWLETVVPGLNAAQLVRKDPLDPDTMVGIVVYYVSFAEDPHG